MAGRWLNDPEDGLRARWHDGVAWTEHTVLKADWEGRGRPPDPTKIEADWYEDPDDPTVLRWWDGDRWTEYTSNNALTEFPSDEDQPRVGAWGWAIAFLGLIGAAIGYFATRDATPRRANHIMKWGLILTVPGVLAWSAASVLVVNAMGTDSPRSFDATTNFASSPSTTESVAKAGGSRDASAERGRIERNPTAYVQSLYDILDRAYCEGDPDLLEQAMVPGPALDKAKSRVGSGGNCSREVVSNARPDDVGERDGHLHIYAHIEGLAAGESADRSLWFSFSGGRWLFDEDA